jgi:hypothetical protein
MSKPIALHTGMLNKNPRPMPRAGFSASWASAGVPASADISALPAIMNGPRAAMETGAWRLGNFPFNRCMVAAGTRSILAIQLWTLVRRNNAWIVTLGSSKINPPALDE